MTDVFISYASEDRERARMLAEAFEAQGWTVWWDRLIPFGKPFDEVIQDNLAAARCVVVLWSAHSVASKWVRSEAAAADERHVLVPVLLDREVQLPLAFRLLQCADLHDWQPGDDSAEYDRLVGQVRALISGKPPDHAAEAPAARRRAAPGRRTRVVLAFLVLPSLVAAAGALVLMHWRVPTQVEIAMRLDRIGFTLAGNEPVALLERAVSFDALSLEQLARIHLRAARLALLDPPRPPRRALALTLEGAPQDRMALDLEAEAPGGNAGRLAALSVEPGTQVVLAVHQGARPALLLRVDGAPVETSVLPARVLLMTASNATVRAPDGFPAALRWRARVEVAESDPLVAVRGIPAAFTAIVAPARAMQVLPDGGAAVSRIELLEQTASGGYASALVAPAHIAYPGHARERVTLEAGSLLSVEGLQAATLAPVAVAPGQADLPVTFRGRVDSIQSRTGGGPPVDHRLSLFDTLWHGARTMLLLGMVAWGTSVTVGAYKLVQETRR